MATAKKPAAPRKAAPAKKAAAPAKAAAPLKPAPVKAPAPLKPAAAVKPAAPVKAATAPRAEKPAKAAKEKKPKLVRDSFTIPKNEMAVLQALKDRAARLGRPAKKSEVLRAGVAALAAMSDVAFTASLQAVPAIKTGRPAKA